MKHAIIYIPGLGDSRVGGQRLAVRLWRFWGVQPELFQMSWADGEPFEPKLERLLTRIDALAKTHMVSLVAASAGATAALNAYAVRQDAIHGVVCIAGKINNPSAVGAGYKRKNPAFWESMQATTNSLAALDAAKRRNILSIRGMFDPIVPARDSIIEGGENRLTIAGGHAVTIGFQITWGAPKFVRWLKNIDN